MVLFIYGWNEYFWPLLVGQAEDVKVLTVAIGVFKSQTPAQGPDWAGLMAATLLSALPILLIFLALGRRIVNSIQISGLK